MIENLREILNGQRILVISPNFFGYESRIVQRLEELGAAVVWFDDRPSNSIFIKLMIRYFPFLSRKYIRNYYTNNILDEFTQILVISAETLTYKNILFLKNKTKANRLILYIYDSLKNKKKLLPVIKYFDKCLTFDLDDAKKYNFIFRPLFFTSTVFGSASIANKYDVSFIGTGHSDRAKIIEKIKLQCEDNSLSYFFYLYLQSPLIYYFKKIFNWRRLKKMNNIFHYQPLGYNEYLDICENSNIIIDIEHPNQKGLTMRTFEMLGKERKVITTNRNIVGYDFFDANNISIINRNNPIIDIKFIEGKYRKISKELYSKYSIDGWLMDIFS